MRDGGVEDAVAENDVVELACRVLRILRDRRRQLLCEIRHCALLPPRRTVAVSVSVCG
jgi:hypothetical protein